MKFWSTANWLSRFFPILAPKIQNVDLSKMNANKIKIFELIQKPSYMLQSFMLAASAHNFKALSLFLAVHCGMTEKKTGKADLAETKLDKIDVEFNESSEL